MLQGYLRKWKYLLGSAFVDLLSPHAIFLKSVTRGLYWYTWSFTSLLRIVRDINKLNNKPLEQWKAYSTTVKRITTTSLGGKAKNNYHCQNLCKLTQAKSLYEAKYQRILCICHCLQETVISLVWPYIDSRYHYCFSNSRLAEMFGWRGAQKWNDFEIEKVYPLEATERLGAEDLNPIIKDDRVDVDKIHDEFVICSAITNTFHTRLLCSMVENIPLP